MLLQVQIKHPDICTHLQAFRHAVCLNSDRGFLRCFGENKPSIPENLKIARPVAPPFPDVINVCRVCTANMGILRRKRRMQTAHWCLRV
jgi:hypothetical protein